LKWRVSEGIEHGGGAAHAFSQRTLIEMAGDAGVVAYLRQAHFAGSEILPKTGAILNPAVNEPAHVAEVRHIDDKIETREIVSGQGAVDGGGAGSTSRPPSKVIQQSAMRGRTRMRDIANRS